MERLTDVTTDLVDEGTNTYSAGIGFDMEFERLIRMVEQWAG